MKYICQILILFGLCRSALSIAGGSIATAHDYPWQALLRFQNVERENWCGGTLIHRRWVATARHCASITTYEIDVGLGMHDLTDIETMPPTDPRIYIVEDGIGHPDYEENPIRYFPFNFGMVLLENDIDPLDPRFRAIEMAPSDPGAPDYDNLSCIVSGWGRTCGTCPVATFLNYGLITVRSQDYCRGSWSDDIGREHICAGGGGTGPAPCAGDSGGPLACNIGGTWTLVGTVAVGQAGCLNERPGIFARISMMKPFINAVIGE